MALYFPDNSIREDTAEFARPQTSNIGLFADAASESLRNGPTEDVFMRAMGLFDPGKHITEDEYKKSEYVRPGINYPDGVGENIAKIKAAAYDQERIRQFELNQAPNNLTSEISRGTGSLLGAALDPINLTTGVVVPEFRIGKVGISFILSKLEGLPTIAKVGARAVGGGIEGATVTTPQALSQYDIQSQLGMSPSSASILSTIGLGAGFGGVIRTFTGFKSPITPEAHQLAMDTAIDQAAKGKAVNIADIVHQGFYEQLQRETNVKIPEQARTNVDDLLTEIDKHIGEKSNALKSLVDEAETKRFINGLRDLNELQPNIRENLQKTIESLDTSSAENQPNQNFLLRNLPAHSQFQEALKLTQKENLFNSPEEQNFIGNFLNKNEKTIASDNIKLNKKLIEDINSRINELDSNKSSDLKTINILHDQLTSLQDKVNLDEKNIDKLNGKPISFNSAEQIKNNLNTLIKTKHFLHQIKNQIEINDLYEPNNIKPVSLDQLKANSDAVHSWKGEAAINEEHLKAYEDAFEGIPDNSLEDINDLENEVNALKLDDEDRKNLDSIKNDDSKFEKLSNAVKELANCLKG